jgi:uncharacterized protein (TIGR01777 family)
VRVLVTGSSGLIGTALVRDLEARGHTVTRLVRRAPRSEREQRWDPERGALEPAAIAGTAAVVHLAGESLAGGRWTETRKRRLWSSRVPATELLSRTIARLDPPPRVLVSASGAGIYGDRGDEPLTERSAPGRGFLAELARAWEAATTPAADRGIRVVVLRQGIVLSRHGGALQKMLPVFRLGLGGPLAGGKAWWSWIAIDDLLEVVRWTLDRESLSGPVHATAPTPVTNAEFTRALARVLRRPAVFPVPAFALRAMFGEMADEALLASARVEPEALTRDGFRFRFPEVEPALRHVLAASA